MSDENYWLRLALEGSEFTKKKLTARIAKLRAAGATLAKLPFDEASQPGRDRGACGHRHSNAEAHGLRHRDRLVADARVRAQCGDRRPHPRPLAARRPNPQKIARSMPGRDTYCRPGVVKHALLTPRNPARSIGYRADRHQTCAPINTHTAIPGYFACSRRLTDSSNGGTDRICPFWFAANLRIWGTLRSDDRNHGNGIPLLS